MNEGIIAGGWEFVWASYIITWVALAAYAGWLVWQDRVTGKEEPPRHGGTP